MSFSLSAFAATMAYAQNAPAQNAPAAGGAGRGAAGATAPAGGGGASRNLAAPEKWAAPTPAAKAYIEKARQIAGNDPDLQFDFEKVFCQPLDNGVIRRELGVPAGAPYTAYPAPNPAVRLPAHKMADNLWYLGDTGVGSFLITSNDGYILMDASNNAAEAQEVIVDAMTKVGLDPKKIKYMVYGHYHADHTGGGHLIQALSGAKAIMGRDDWTLYLKMFENPATMRLDDKVPMTRDIDAVDGMTITVGDVTATIHQMTGHTPGSIGMIVPVRYKGANRPILIVTAATDVKSREAFVGGYEHIWDAAIKAKVEAVYQVHPNTNMNHLSRLKYVNDNYNNLTSNPLIPGVDKATRHINIMRACTQARMELLGW